MDYQTRQVTLSRDDREFSEEQNDKTVILLFLIWPFAGTVWSFFRINRSVSLYLIGIFCLLYGWTFNPINDQLDSYRYAQEFYLFLRNPQVNFSSALSDYISGDLKDIYSSICYYVTSLLGGDIRVLFFIIAIVFAFFQIKSLQVIFQQPSVKKSIILFILVYLVVYSNSIFNINGFRYWTAAWVGVYATFKILVEKRFRYILLLMVTPLIHGSFWMYIGFVLVCYSIRIDIKPLFIIFVISFFFTEIVLNNLVLLDESILPKFMQNLLYSYTESEGALKRISGESIEDQPLYWKILTNLPRYYELFLVAVMAVKSKNFSSVSIRVLKFLLFYLTIVNLFSAIPSFVRFYFPMVPILSYVWVRESNQMIKNKRLVYAIPLVLLYGSFQLVRYVLSVNDMILFAPVTVFGVIFKGLV